MIVLVCKAFRYNPEELEALPYQEFLRRVAMAEVIEGVTVQVGETEEAPEAPPGVNFQKESQELQQFEGPGPAGDDTRRQRSDLRARYLQQRGLSGPDANIS